MREKYQSLALSDLREIAKSRGIQGVSAMKKPDVIEAMLALDEKEKKAKTEEGLSAEEKEARAVREKEDKEKEAAGEWVISCGSEEVEIMQMEYYGWNDEGIYYSLVGFDCGFGEEAMAQMAAEIMAE